MSKHTPGPWVFKRNLERLDCDHIATVAWCADFRIGLDCGSSSMCNYESHGSTEADARLISAAPELLEALQAALPFMEDEWGHYSELSGGGNCLKLARAAIAKATGEQQ